MIHLPCGAKHGPFITINIAIATAIIIATHNCWPVVVVVVVVTIVVVAVTIVDTVDTVGSGRNEK